MLIGTLIVVDIRCVFEHSEDGSLQLISVDGLGDISIHASGDTALLFTEQLLVFATIIGSVAALPSFIEFISGVRKRKERIDLSLEDEAVDQLHPRLDQG